MALVRIKQNFQITLPVEVRKHLNIALGDLLEVTVRDNAIVLTPKAVVDRPVDAATHQDGEPQIADA
jgi:AbrB family looped-hinge helix DNA binding protein